MLDLQIVSDLHIEYKNNSVPNPLDLITPVSNVLVLAGDIGSLYKFEQLKNFLIELCVHFEIVIYVPGNHEYYYHDYDTTEKPVQMNILNERLFSLEKVISNIHILNQSSIVINNICITGCTLWTKPEITIPKYIVRIHGMNTMLYDKKHTSDLQYVENMIKYCADNKVKMVVVTHHCPTYKVLTDNDRIPSKKRDRLSSLYVSELDHLLNSEYIDTWICGHIHQNFDFKSSGGTRIVGNQYGKPKDNIEDYSKHFTVHIE